MGPCSWISLVLPCFPPSWSSWFDRMVDWPFEDSITALARWQYLTMLGQGSQGCKCFESTSKIWCCFPHSQDSQVQESRRGNGSGTTHYYPWWPTSKMFVSCSCKYMLCWPRCLSSMGGMLLPGDTTMIPPGHFGLLTPLNQQAKKGITALVLTGVIDPHYQGEIGLLLYNRGKEEHVWNTGDPWRHLLVLPWPVIKVNGKLQQPKSGRTTNGPDPSGIKCLGHPTS